jgi:hypothetical protein
MIRLTVIAVLGKMIKGNPLASIGVFIWEIENVCTCVHFKDSKLATLCTVCTRDHVLRKSFGGSAQLDYYRIPSLACSQRSFSCEACITKYSFETELQLMITTMSKTIPKSIP